MVKILLTGSSGFVGSYLKDRLINSYHLSTLGRHNCNNIICDLSLSQPRFRDKFYFVIHNAGKAHVVPKTELERKDFFQINVEGTKKLLRGLVQSPRLPNSLIFISSVSVYGQENGNNFTENTPLLAQDPYGRSKIEAEDIVMDWGIKHGVVTGILRLPLIVGKNPPGNLGAMLKAIKKEYYFNIGQGQARRSMILVEDIAEIIPTLAQKGGVYNLTDGYHPSYAEISQKIGLLLNKPVRQLPVSIARTLACIGSGIQTITRKSFPFNKRVYSKMTSSLTFTDEKARKELGWKPRPVLEHLDELF